MEFRFLDQTLRLYPGKGMFWVEKDTLIISDTHFGKGTSFRNKGIPVPAGNTSATLERLSELLSITEASRLLIVGDLIHAKDSISPETLESLKIWRRGFELLDISLVVGNHDIISGPPPDVLNIRSYEPDLEEPPFIFSHKPLEHMNLYSICGHIHPSVTLHESWKSRATFPCFCFREKYALLPAFGEFTGTHRVIPAGNDKVFIITDERVIDVSTTGN